MVKNRLVSTGRLLDREAPSLVADTVEEVMALQGYSGRSDAELSALEKVYIADLTAARVLKYVLDRYMQDAKVKEGPDGLVHEAPDKLKFLREQAAQFEKSAEFAAGRLGLNLDGVPPLVVRIGAAAEGDG